MAENEHPQSPIYDQNIIEFVTVAAEYCATMEGNKQKAREFLERIIKIAALLYLKASLLPTIVPTMTSRLSQYVTEEQYENMRNRFAGLLGEKDNYLECFSEDMQYSETAIPASIAEDLTDVYQNLKDMILNFQTANTTVMEEAIENCKEDFETFWGQKLLNAMGAMHNIIYSPSSEFGEEDSGEFEKNE